MIRAAFLALLLAAMAPAGAHPAPNSILRLDFHVDSVTAELLVPVSELAYATAGPPAADTLAAYLLRHVGAETPAGDPWSVEIADVRATTYLDHDYFRAELKLAPPRGATVRNFVLVSDVVTHEVRNHVVYVVANAELLGALQYPARRLLIHRSSRSPAAEDPRRQSNQRPQKAENAFDRDANQPKGQRQKPDNWP